MTERRTTPALFATPVGPLLTGLFLFGVVAAMVSALLQTLSLTITNPVPVDGSHFAFIGSPPVDFADRLSVFTSAGTNLTVVLMLVVASVLTRLQPQGGWRRAAAVSVELLAAVVVVSDIVMAVEVGISNGPLFLPGVDTTTRATGIVGLLAPASLAAAAGLVVAFGRRREGPRDPSTPDPETT